MSWKPFCTIESIRNAAAFTEAEDRARGAFLNRLDGAEFDITEFEESFVASFLTGVWVWTPGRRATCDKMRQVYEGRLGGSGARGQIGRAHV